MSQEDDIRNAGAKASAEWDEIFKTEVFVSFLAKVTGKADLLADEILHRSDITPEIREGLRLERMGILDVLKMLEEDRAGHANLARS